MIIHIASGRYPLTVGHVRAENPNVSMPDQPTGAMLEPLGYAPVTATEPPAHDADTQRVEEGAPVLIGGIYRQTWAVVDLPAGERRRRVTVLGFRNRFTNAEKVALERAAQDDPNAEEPARLQKAQLRVYLEDTKAASYIDLDRPDTRGGVQALEALGLIATGRAAQILDAPITTTERYREN